MGWAAHCTFGALLLFGGCKVGPDFRRPKPPPIAPDFTEATADEAAAYDELTYWWAALEDPVLNGLIAEACQQNLDLREAAHRIAASRARLGVVRADRLPQADATADYNWRDFAENATQFISSTAGNRGFSFHSLGFDTSWEIDLFGRIGRSIESAAADLDADVESYRDVKVTLLSEVATTYVRLRLAQERRAIAERNLASQEETLRIVRERRESGLVSPLDVAQAESNVYRTAATIPELRQLETIAVNQLALLLGRSPDPMFHQRLIDGPLPVLPASLAVGVPADLLTRRPDVRRAERQVASASALIGAAVAEKYPQISILGTVAVEAKDIDLLFTNGSLAHRVGPSLRWNILNFNQLNNAIAGRGAEFRIAVVNYQRTVLTAVQEVEDGLVTFHRQGERAAELMRAVDATGSAVERSEIRYERGLIGFQPVLDSQRELLAAEDALASSRAETLLGVIRVYKALGGGWDSKCACEIASAETAPSEEIQPGEEGPEMPGESLPDPASLLPDTDDAGLASAGLNGPGSAQKATFESPLVLPPPGFGNQGIARSTPTAHQPAAEPAAAPPHIEMATHPTGPRYR
ncbi:MAG: efflux transporter outer membrane subunit [Planctomycetota bacterium]